MDAPDGAIVDEGPRGFAALAMFARPLALREAIARLESGEGTETDFMPTMSVINMPIDEGALADADRGPTRGWSDPVEHARMLHDDRRTGDYLDALAQAVRPGGVMLDTDTGRGVLAIAAPPAGARRVRAVEASDIAEVADRVFATNGVQDTVTLIPDWSRRLDLPESADLLVSELIGNEPFDEEILGNSASGTPFARRLLPGLWRTIDGIFKLASTPGRSTVLTVSLPWPSRARRR